MRRLQAVVLLRCGNVLACPHYLHCSPSAPPSNCPTAPPCALPDVGVRLEGVALSWRSGQAFYVPLHRRDDLLVELAPLFVSPAVGLLGLAGVAGGLVARWWAGAADASCCRSSLELHCWHRSAVCAICHHPLHDVLPVGNHSWRRQPGT